jgi:hypothetical protein
MKKQKSKKNTASYKFGRAIGKQMIKIGKTILKSHKRMFGR